MHYWNKDNFEGLEEIAANAANRSSLREFGAYCKLRAEGRRKEAFSALQEFVAFATSMPMDGRKEITVWLLQAQLRSPNVHQLLPFPLMKQVIEPTLDEWSRCSPNSGEAQRWIGLVRQEKSALEKAIALDPTDETARRLLISRSMNDVDHAMHHLVEGFFLGSEEDVMKAICQMEEQIPILTDDQGREGIISRLKEQKQLLADWLEFKTDPDGTFPMWCAKMGRQYQWPSIVYYTRS